MSLLPSLSLWPHIFFLFSHQWASAFPLMIPNIVSIMTTLKPTSSPSSSKLLSSRPTFLTPHLTQPPRNPTGITDSECSKLSSHFLPQSLPVSTAGSLPYGMSQHRPSWPSQKTVITLHSSSFSHSSYPAIHEALPADLPLQYHSGLFISPSLKFYSSLCHDCLMSASGWPPSFSISPASNPTRSSTLSTLQPRGAF